MRRGAAARRRCGSSDVGSRLVVACQAAAVLAAAACAPSQGGADGTGHVASADSIVLERTVCFGFCPAYRLAIAGDGTVTFALQGQRGAPDEMRHDSIPPDEVVALLGRAREVGFFSLPDEITPANREACPLAATDHPSAIVTIAVADTVKRVNHYHGCHAQSGMTPGDAYPALTAFESAIDSVAAVARWLPRR
ncbi:MAG TPA: DUF6438 domain-containing protein [Gemmatimonadaceae bacterium]|nr:DUF6438 domain-containing protein [Gemmatimonadaceae bacterium]